MNIQIFLWPNACAGEVVFELNQQAVFYLVCLFWQLAFELPSCLWTELSYVHASSTLCRRLLLLITVKFHNQNGSLPFLCFFPILSHRHWNRSKLIQKHSSICFHFNLTKSYRFFVFVFLFMSNVIDRKTFLECSGFGGWRGGGSEVGSN